MQSHIGAVGFFACFSSGSMKDLGGTPVTIYGSAQLKCSEGSNAVMGCVMEKKSASKDFLYPTCMRNEFSGSPQHCVMGAVNEPKVVGRCHYLAPTIPF